jgi:hypothetical protein
MEAKHGAIFDDVVAACRVKHLRDVMSFQNNWNNEIIAQFYATFEQFARHIFRGGQLYMYGSKMLIEYSLKALIKIYHQ